MVEYGALRCAGKLRLRRLRLELEPEARKVHLAGLSLRGDPETSSCRWPRVTWAVDRHVGKHGESSTKQTLCTLNGLAYGGGDFS